MLKDIIIGIFNSVSYWKEKKLLLQAMPSEYYRNKRVIIQLLGIAAENVSFENQAKKDMWNYHVVKNYMGDDILKNTDPSVLDDMDFARRAIAKYNRTYVFLSKRLQASRELAMYAATNERNLEEGKHNLPILHYMPKTLQDDREVSLIATTRNIENLAYAPTLKKNKYFIIDMMNLLDDDKTKERVLNLIDQSLLNDKKFLGKLGYHNDLYERFKDDIEYIANSVEHDIDILRKIEIFDEQIIRHALRNSEYGLSREYILAEVFRYIERFNHDYRELFTGVEDKKILYELFWEMAEKLSEEFI